MHTLLYFNWSEKLKWITSKTSKTNSRLFKTGLRLFQSCFKTIKDYLKTIKRLIKDYLKPMVGLLQDIFRDNFKDYFKATKLISTQLGTTQPQLVLQYYLYKKCPKFKNVPIWSEGEVNIFQKCLKFKNVPNVGGGEGVNPNWDIVPNFLVFFSDASP